jgi:hypothetical protein
LPSVAHVATVWLPSHTLPFSVQTDDSQPHDALLPDMLHVWYGPHTVVVTHAVQPLLCVSHVWASVFPLAHCSAPRVHWFVQTGVSGPVSDGPRTSLGASRGIGASLLPPVSRGVTSSFVPVSRGVTSSFVPVSRGVTSSSVPVSRGVTSSFVPVSFVPVSSSTAASSSVPVSWTVSSSVRSLLTSSWTPVS